MRTVKEVTFAEIDKMISDLDTFSRIFLGQYDEIFYKVRGIPFFSTDDPYLLHALLEMRKTLIDNEDLRHWGLSASLGIWGSDTPEIAIKAYDIQQNLRFQLSYHLHPEGGITRNFDHPYTHGNWKISKQQMDDYHALLKEQNTPGYARETFPRRVWTCPVILKFMEGDQAKMLVDDPEVLEIIEKAKEFDTYMKDRDFMRLFLETKKIQNPEVEDEVVIKLAEDIITAYKNAFEEDGFKP